MRAPIFRVFRSVFRNSRSQTSIYISTKKKLVKKLPKAYPPHVSRSQVPRRPT